MHRRIFVLCSHGHKMSLKIPSVYYYNILHQHYKYETISCF